MAVELEQFIKHLEDCGILEPEAIKDFVPPRASPESAEKLARELVRRKKLTDFQAERLLEGKGKSLVLGNYVLLQKIGQGGMGAVYKAQHRRMKRVVAVKTLPDILMKDAAAVARFQREVEAAARLRHANVVAADDADAANGVHFLVIEYVDGKDLSALVKQDGPLPLDKAVNCIVQAARGLEFAHNAGVVHRDIKPANLLLDKNGTVKILDMGLARIEQADGFDQTELTGTGMIMGTVDYMAPEQAINTRNADHRADIYSLGISLYYLLSGKAAYGGATAMEKLMAHQTQPIPSLQDVQATVPKQLDAIFKKMVAKKVEDRYQSMSDVIEALERLGFGGAITVTRGDTATALALSSEDRTMLTSKARQKPLGTPTKVVASEKSKDLVAKIVGGAFATIIALILVTFLIKHPGKQDEPTPIADVDARTPNVAPNEAVVAAPPQPLVAPFNAAQAKAGQAAWAGHLRTQVETTNSIGAKMILIPPGGFLMGSTDEEQINVEKDLKAENAGYGWPDSERPQHRVVLTQPFLMGQTEITIGQFKKFAAATGYQTEAEKADQAAKAAAEQPVPAGQPAPDPYQPKGTYLNIYRATDECHAIHLTWNDAVVFCIWLSNEEQLEAPYEMVGKRTVPTGKGYHLPTEAQWEYACRAGTTTLYWYGNDRERLEDFASLNYSEVGAKPPNAFGLHDMQGSAWEWCQDWFDATWYVKSPTNDPIGPLSRDHRVLRGGAWAPPWAFCRSAFRLHLEPTDSTYHYGFRVVRTF